MNETAQKTALVTGAARGIGLATAKRFLADGWRVALLDIDADTLNRSHAALAGNGATTALCCDVADRDGVGKAFATLAQQFGRLDALVNNAGIAIFKPILDVSYEDWSRVLAVNLTGPFLCTQAAAPLMRDSGGGAVVNITSISGLRASTLRTAYGTSKAGLAHLTQQQAIELAPLGIRVNAVAPGPVDTAMAKAVHTPDIRAAYPLWARGRARRSDFLFVQRPGELYHRPDHRRRRRLRGHRHRPAGAAPERPQHLKKSGKSPRAASRPRIGGPNPVSLLHQSFERRD
jgi:NAD(P)-dependent dehydrogenase (short-subunit alcohol dehydrogenase family)